MTFLLILSLLIFLGSVIRIIFLLFKKKNKKTTLIAMLVSLILFVIAAINLPQSETAKTDEVKTTEKTKDKKEKTLDYSKANKEMNEELLQDSGWALGKLDENGEETENGEPNPDFAYAIFVTKAELSEEDEQLNVYTTPEFSALNDDEKQEIIHRVQNKSTLYTKNNERIFTVIYNDNNQIGMSKATDISTFKFKK